MTPVHLRRPLTVPARWDYPGETWLPGARVELRPCRYDRRLVEARTHACERWVTVPAVDVLAALGE